MHKRLYTPGKGKALIAQFMSGSGTNVEKVLEQEKEMEGRCPYETVVIITDDKRSNALKIGKLFDKITAVFDIRDFQESKYLGRRLTLETDAHRKAREEYSEKLADYLLNICDIDFGVFGGFVPLTNITEYFPCLNVHPGDVTYLKDGRPYLVGLHTVPIERALAERIGYVRSSVIQSMPYMCSGSDMDNGPFLGLGPKLFYEDERNPEKILKALKIVSDWKILPKVVLATASGEIEVEYEANQAKNPVIMDLEFRISDVDVR